MDFTKNRPGGVEKTTATLSLPATLPQTDPRPLVVEVDAAESNQAALGYEPVLVDSPPTLEPILLAHIER